jgi:gamma-glutamyltranspeptidase/glutathione hydrolase
MMSPTIVLDDNDSLELVMGSGGASRIPFAIGQTLNYLIEEGLSLKDAICAPRVHWHERKLQAEYKEAFSGLPKEEYKTWDQIHMFFGGVHAIHKKRKELESEADPRRYGVAEIF